jgi:DNA-binding CsgD family transcriptional regulator
MPRLRDLKSALACILLSSACTGNDHHADANMQPSLGSSAAGGGLPVSGSGGVTRSGGSAGRVGGSASGGAGSPSAGGRADAPGPGGSAGSQSHFPRTPQLSGSDRTGQHDRAHHDSKQSQHAQRDPELSHELGRAVEQLAHAYCRAESAGLDESTVVQDPRQGFNVPPENLALGRYAHARADWAESVLRCYRTHVCGTLDEHIPELHLRRAMRDQYEPMGLRDQLLINGVNHSGFGCALYVFSRIPLRLANEERQMLTRIAAHLATAYRLQRRLERASTDCGATGVDAILNTHGGLEHAELTARSMESRRRLTSAVKQREWARTRAGRSNPERATDAWKPLVMGRWSLVDCYERDGQRYITARENFPAPTGLDMLSPRERQVASFAELGRSNKEIAYELGLGHSTVRVLLARAASKLQVHTRAELIARVRSLQQRAVSPRSHGGQSALGS